MRAGQASAGTGRLLRRSLIVVALIGLFGVALLGLGAAWLRPVGQSMQLRNELVVDAWRVGGGPLERLEARDTVRRGDVVQVSVTSTVNTRVGAWTRDRNGEVRARFGREGAVVEPGERVVVDRMGPLDARLGTLMIAVRVCPETQDPGDDPWSTPVTPTACRPFLWTLQGS